MPVLCRAPKLSERVIEDMEAYRCGSLEAVAREAEQEATGQPPTNKRKAPNGEG